MSAPAPDSLKRLVDHFDQNRKVFLTSDYKEEQLRLTAGRQVKSRKASSVYYTPTCIGDCIVKNTVGKLLEGGTPAHSTRARWSSTIPQWNPYHRPAARTGPDVPESPCLTLPEPVPQYGVARCGDSTYGGSRTWE